MNSEWKQKWIEALKSGKYQQTNNYLRDKIGYCCWGVACDLYNPNSWSPNSFGEFNYDESIVFPPVYVQKAMGVDKKIVDRLATMNDDGKSFNEIAQYIEENL